MKNRTFISLTVAALLAACTTLQAEPPSFKDFSAICKMGEKRMNFFTPTPFSFNRNGIIWDKLEPVKGKWDEAAFDKYKQTVLANRKKNIQFLPLLGYSASWIYTDKEYNFTFKKDKYWLKRKFIKLANGKWNYIVIRSVDGKKWEKRINRIMGAPKLPFGKENIVHWQNYVRKVVSELMKPPYNLRYFQIWNEAHPASGFYNGTLDQYMKEVHLPAAKVIRELGGKIVYGGWADSPPIRELIALLDKYNAWNTIDIIDVHYKPIFFMDYLQKVLKQRGFPGIGVWQTEVSYTRKYYYIPRNYPLTIYWGLLNKPEYKDKYKLFFFPFWSKNIKKREGYGRGLVCKDTITPHGVALKTLYAILGDAPLEAYSNLSADGGIPAIPKLNARKLPKIVKAFKQIQLCAIKAGKKILIVLLPSKKIRAKWSADKRKTIVCKLPGIKKSDIASVTRIGVFNDNIAKLTAEDLPGGGCVIKLPVKETKLYSDDFFVEKSPYRPAFYCVIELQ